MGITSEAPHARRRKMAIGTKNPSVESHGRALVRDLIKQHEKQIIELRTAMRQVPLFNEDQHDDLWLLRFVLSHKGATAAYEAAQRCLIFRHEHSLDDPNFPIGGPEALKVPAVEHLFSQMKDESGMLFYKPDADRGAIYMITPALIGLRTVAANVSEEDYRREQRLAAEWLFRQCDETTRRTGYLTKYTRLLNLEGMSLTQVDSGFLKRVAAAHREMDFAYPQLLGGVLVCNAPGWINAVFRGMRPLLPERIINKVDFVAPKSVQRDRERLLKLMEREHQPPFLGGTCQAWPPANARFMPQASLVY